MGEKTRLHAHLRKRSKEVILRPSKEKRKKKDTSLARGRGVQELSQERGEEGGEEKFSLIGGGGGGGEILSSPKGGRKASYEKEKGTTFLPLMGERGTETFA